MTIRFAAIPALVAPSCPLAALLWAADLGAVDGVAVDAGRASWLRDGAAIRAEIERAGIRAALAQDAARLATRGADLAGNWDLPLLADIDF